MSKMYEALQYAYTQQELESTKNIPPPVFLKQKLEKSHQGPQAIDFKQKLKEKPKEYLPVLRTIPKSPPSAEVMVYGPEMGPEMLQLQQSIAALRLNSCQNVLQFIGSHQGEGTSTILREFGKVLATQHDKSVLLIDMDSKYSTAQHEAFGLRPKNPLEVLMKRGGSIDAVITRVPQSQIFLSLLTEEKLSNSNTSWLTNNETTWEPIRKQFDFILIDSPPLSMSVDGLTLCPTVDGVIVVVEAERTRAPVLLTLKDRIIKSGGNILGVAFNKQRHYIPHWVYKLL